MDTEILLIGEALIDIVRRPGEAPACFAGGCSLNTAIGLARLGDDPILATWFASDQYGLIIQAHCRDSNLRLLPGSDQAKHTTLANAEINAAGQASYTFDLDLAMPAIPADLQPGIIHTGSLAAMVDPAGADVLAYIESRRGRSFIAFDPNCRPAIMGAPEQARQRAERYVAASTLVKVSDEDLAWLYPEAATEAGLADQARKWRALGPEVVVLTRGGQGARAFAAAGECTIPADTSHGLVDTVGAGDSFMTGLIHGIAHHGYIGPDKHFDANKHFGADLDELAAILAQASAIAGITVSRAGANPPWLYEL